MLQPFRTFQINRFFFLLALALTALSALGRPAFGRTWYIKADGSGDAPTIQAGVDLAAAGDIVLVASGSYTDTCSPTRQRR